MALQYGIYAANYPFTEEDLNDFQLPASLRPYKSITIWIDYKTVNGYSIFGSHEDQIAICFT